MIESIYNCVSRFRRFDCAILKTCQSVQLLPLAIERHPSVLTLMDVLPFPRVLVLQPLNTQDLTRSDWRLSYLWRFSR